MSRERVTPLLLLIGLRGSGKTTLGRALRERRGLAWQDLDDATAARMGCASVGEAWAAHGEAAFRAAEAAALGEAIARGRGVFSLGGGTPTAPGAAAMIERAAREGRAVVVYLRATPQDLRRNLEAAGERSLRDRPSLTGDDPLREIEVVFQQRDALYTRLATRVIPVSGDIEDALRALDGWERWADGRGGPG